jgi:hypothetical protein
MRMSQVFVSRTSDMALDTRRPGAVTGACPTVPGGTTATVTLPLRQPTR